MIYLPKDTVCSHFSIGYPRWNGGDRIVGLNRKQIMKHNAIDITYVSKKTGKRIYPDTLYFDGDRLKTEKFNVQMWGGAELVLVPIKTLPTLTRERPIEELTGDKIPLSIRQTFFESNQRRLL